MANVDFARGLKPVTEIRKRRYLGNTSTDIFRGDVVQMQANGRLATITTTTGNAKIVGVAATFVDASASSSAQNIWVYDHPDQDFEIQDDGASATPAQANVGATAPLVITTGNTTTKQSKHELDVSGIGAAATDAVKIIGFITGGGSEIAKYARYRVQLNRHIYDSANAGV